jgi:thiazole/oxazole-forming peptide maturase SagD family component
MIKIAIHSRYDSLSLTTNALLKKMLGPLCGMVREIGFLRRPSRGPKIISTGSDLTGVHILLNKPNPGRGGYHIGAAGISFNEAVIKTLGESVERYAQLVAEISGRFTVKFMSYSQLVMTEGNTVLPPDKFDWFVPRQYQQNHFPLQPYTDQPLGWVKLPSFLGAYSLWVPAQLVLVGYRVKHTQHEPWISPAVTTGTAAHTDKVKALLNAVLELIQIDSAMGHWYSEQHAKKITFDSRTQSLEKILLRQGYFSHQDFMFYSLENPDLLGFSVACVYRKQEGIPKMAVGLGSDVSLNKAMYKAYLEAIGVIGLSRMIVFQKKAACTHPEFFYDLDTNVGFYALGRHHSMVREKFPLENSVRAGDLPPDLDGDETRQLSLLVESFKKSGKALFFCDLTCVEAADLGLTVPRVWSPDTLSLCLPGAPWIKHPRYLDYGGFANELPHPYP